ncbi:hypothetical protein ABZ749_04080 [Micromonospora sp. NPDC047753]|uniref:hypothetical protein n=1 Tax=Micromonospora sp. NPDC047753 TaxID=3154817 RepID=UPI003410889B
MSAADHDAPFCRGAALAAPRQLCGSNPFRSGSGDEILVVFTAAKMRAMGYADPTSAT